MGTTGEELTKPNSLSKFVKASSLQTSGALRNLTKTMGFKNTALGITGVMDMYQREMDLALIKVSTGAFSFDQAVKDCVHRLAQSGLRSIDYEVGDRTNLTLLPEWLSELECHSYLEKSQRKI